MKIAFVGAPGSGKTTLASDVFASLKARGENVEMVHEWVRHDIHKNGPMHSIWEQYRTRQHQKELEDAVPASVATVIADSSTLTSYFYAALYVDATDARQRLVLQDMYRYLIDDLFLCRYDLIFHVAPVAGTPVEDGTRYQNASEIAILTEHMALMFTKLFRLPNVHTVAGRFEDRLDDVLGVIRPRHRSWAEV